MVAARFLMLALCCVGCAPDPLVTTAELHLHALPSCPLDGLASLRLTLDGDFPSIERPFDGDTPYALDLAPFDSEWLGVEGERGALHAAGSATRERAERGAGVLMLPLDVSCPLGDPLAAGFDGAAVSALADGALLIAGGRLDDGSAIASAALLPPGEQLARAVEGGMLLRRAGASATAFDGGALIAGGGPDDTSTAHDTFERFDLASQRFVPPGKLADGARRDHAAALLPDGRVLLVGGSRVLAGEAIGSAELIDPISGNAQVTGGLLTDARVQPSALVLDDGTVLIALGHAADGTAVRSVERFDPAGESFDTVAELPAHAASAVAALEGRRVAYVGCDPGAACELGVLLPAGDGFDYHASAIDSVSGLEQLRLLALRDGQLLLTASTVGSGVPRAYSIDLAAERALELPGASRAANALVALADGTIVELDPFGASLRRHDVASVLHDAPDPVIGDGTAHVALDLGERWTLSSGLSAAMDARFDLPALRFAELRIELAIAGDGDLLLEPDGAPALRVELRSDRLRVPGGLCRLARAKDEPLVIERDGQALTLRAGNASERCELPVLGDGRIGVALEALAGTEVQRLRVLRR